MRNRNTADLLFFGSLPHPCEYFSDRKSIKMMVDPGYPMSAELYAQLMDQGFRRSGELVYRPRCRGCQACVSTRVPVERFQPNRSQRRCARDNADLALTIKPAHFTEEYFSLYERYVNFRHPGGGMDQPEPDEFLRAMTSYWSGTLFLEFRDGRRLLAVAVIDPVPQGLSAVYTFFEPEAAARGLGVYAILTQIEQVRHIGRPYLYLGYWIENCSKMSYKRRYQPIEGLIDGSWRELEPG